MRKYSALILLWAAFWMASCQKTTIPEPDPVDPSPKTLIFYGNIGEPYYTANINAAGGAVAEGALIRGQRIIVYHHYYRGSEGSSIYELVRDPGHAGGFRRDTLKMYAADEVSPMDPEQMREIITYMRDAAPADHYGLSFGSHGRGWLPKNYVTRVRAIDDPFAEVWEEKADPKTRFLGHGTAAIDIPEFADAIGDMDWDFIQLDACLMASIEAVYEMRGMADYIIASPAEVVIDGFPYKPIVQSLFKDWSDLESVGRIFVEYYKAKRSYATVSLIDNSELEALAKTVRNIRLNGYNEITPEQAAEIQAFEGLGTHLFYDLDDYMRNWAANDNAVLYGAFLDQMGKTVVYKDHTAYYNSNLGIYGAFPIYHYSGLTAHIPTTAVTSLLSDYRNTAWYKAVYE